MSDLPFGICRDILLRLPAESLFRLRSISKVWRAIIDHPSFVIAHTQNQSSSSKTLLIRNSTGPPFYPLYLVDLEALNFTINAPQSIPATPLKLTRAALSRIPPLPLASCNGLLLISPANRVKDILISPTNSDNTINMDEGIWEIWNLLTHERLKLPHPNIEGQVCSYGLGYDSVSNNYKVLLRVCTGSLNRNKYVYTIQNHVYSLKSNSWRMIGGCPYNFLTQEGVFLNGALHFLSSRYMIFALAVRAERYRSPMKLPAVVVDRRWEHIQLAALGGCLSLSCRNKSSTKYEGWVMNCYGAEGTWVKLYSFRDALCLYNLRPVAYVKDRKGVLAQHQDGLLWIDIDGNLVKSVRVHGFCRDSSAQTFVGSLFPLRESCGSVSAKGRTRKRIPDTRLTFCMTDYNSNDSRTCKDLYADHEDCYSSDPNH